MNKRGGTMIEAAVVFPLVILSLMGIICILMFLVEDATGQAGLHQALRWEAGAKTGNYLGPEGSSKAAVGEEFRGMYHVVSGKASIAFEGSGILSRSFRKSLTGYQYLTDERKYAQYIDLFNLEDNHDEDKLENESKRPRQ
jgi:hypothetical protein